MTGSLIDNRSSFACAYSLEYFDRPDEINQTSRFTSSLLRIKDVEFSTGGDGFGFQSGINAVCSFFKLSALNRHGSYIVVCIRQIRESIGESRFLLYAYGLNYNSRLTCRNRPRWNWFNRKRPVVNYDLLLRVAKSYWRWYWWKMTNIYLAVANGTYIFVTVNTV